MPIGSWPRMSPAVMYGPSTSYRCRSEPQIAVEVILTIASVGSWMVGSGTSSTRTSRLPCQVTAFTVNLLVVEPAARGRSCSAATWDGRRDEVRRSRITPQVLRAVPSDPIGKRRRRVSAGGVTGLLEAVSRNAAPAGPDPYDEQERWARLDGRRRHPAAGCAHHRRVQWDRPVDRPRAQRAGLESGAGLPVGDRACCRRAGMRRIRHRNTGCANRCR